MHGRSVDELKYLVLILLSCHIGVDTFPEFQLHLREVFLGIQLKRKSMPV